MRETFLNGRVTLHCGDNREMLASLPDASIDSIVTDPPYELNFMGKGWDDTGIANDPALWREVSRVLKPGGHLAAFSASRTYHRMTCAIEDAGFEIRDSLLWIYGTGFPKSQNVSAFIDKMAGAERPVVGFDAAKAAQQTAKQDTNSFGDYAGNSGVITAPVTPAAIEFQGFGTALKPAFEPIVLARKPLSERTVAANVLKWRTGALNIDGCRVAGEMGPDRALGKPRRDDNGIHGTANTTLNPQSPLGRWPANIIHDGSEEVVAAFPETKAGGSVSPSRQSPKTAGIYGEYKDAHPFRSHSDVGSAARLFYSAKADADDRLGSAHPTVKPVDLMQWLVRLVTPKGGTVLDPFAGTGTTAEAAFREGMNCVLIEREEEYQDDIRCRMKLVMAGPDEKRRESIKAKLKDKPTDAGPLFGGVDV